MKKINILLLIITLAFISCKNTIKNNTSSEPKKADIAYASFGDTINDQHVISKEEMLTKYNAMSKGDTIQVKFSSKINKVCKKKGCWMSLTLDKDHESFVKFKDYDFFVPLNADGRDVIVDGKAFLKITSIKELQHYAKDAGKSEEEIAKITEPKRTLAFEATGVLMTK